MTNSATTKCTASVVVVIPARYNSSRFPGKPLANISGKPMIQRVYDAARGVDADRVLVATDDRRIFDCVESFGGEVTMTSGDHRTGTDRIAEAISNVEGDIVLNVQGDEPLLPVDDVNSLIHQMVANSHVQMGTIAVPLAWEAPAFTDPNVVKVALGNDGFAVYFSRSPIPYRQHPSSSTSQPLRHWGVYAFRREFLVEFVSWPQGTLEATESLEQLRALEHGVRILVHIGNMDIVGVDVPADIRKVEAILGTH